MKKSLRRKLLLSGLAMGVAAISLASTTYAWFSNITTVKANTIQANVNVPTSLLISANGSQFQAAVSLESDASLAATIDPVKAVWTNAESPIFYELTGEAKEMVNDQGTFTGTITDWATEAAKPDDTKGKLCDISEGDVFYDTFTLKYEALSGASMNITGTVEIVTPASLTDEICKAMTLVLVEDGEVVHTTVLAGPSADLSVDLGAITVGTNRTFTVYLYLNGESTSCYNSAITANTNFNVTMSFAETVTPPTGE